MSTRLPPTAPRVDPRFSRVLMLNGLVPVVAASVLGGLLIWQALLIADLAGAVQHAEEVLTADYRVANTLNRMEGSERGYLLTGDPTFRYPYDSGVIELEGTIQRLANLVADAPPQLAKAREIDTLAARWQALAMQEMAGRDAHHGELGELLKRSNAHLLMQQLRDLLADMRKSEGAVRQQRSDELDQQTRFATGMGLVGLLLTLAFFVLFSVRQSRMLDAKHQANTAQLADQAEELRDLYEQLRVQNEALESRVETRTEELRTAMGQAEAASQAKSMFLANMSHELRTPLNAVLGYSEMLAEEATERGAADMVPDLAKINAAGRHLLGLINDILDLSKIEAGKMDLYIEEVDLGALLLEAADMAQGLIAARGNSLILEVPADLPLLHTDAMKVRQTVFNLLSNAGKFTEAGTVVLGAAVEVDGAAGWLRIWVHDTGIGMEPERVEKLFMEFTQADAGHTRKYGGTGLGLAISRRFCQLLGGEITATSVPHEGSTFTVRLPFSAASAGIVPAASDGKESILVIDDDPRARELMVRYLERDGYRVLLAETGNEGLELARLLRPDAIVLDVIMPGLDGWSVLTALKEDMDLAHIPVIMTTMLDDRSLGFSLGASEFLIKPVERPRLLGTLRRLLAGKPTGAILVVDDDPQSRALIKSLLLREGYVAEEAADGREALAIAETRRPALVLLDLMMPVMDGFAFIDAVRQNPELAGLPIVVITAQDLTPEETLRLSRTAQGILAKASPGPERMIEGLKLQLDRALGHKVRVEAPPVEPA